MSRPPKGSLTFVDAAVEVLRRRGEALSLEEILGSALQMGLLRPRGKTPLRSLSARLYLELARPHPRVRRVAIQRRARAARHSVRWALAGR